MEFEESLNNKLKAIMTEGFQVFERLEEFLSVNFNKNINSRTHKSEGLERNISIVIEWAASENWMGDLLNVLSQHTNLTIAVTAKSLRKTWIERQPLAGLVVDPLDSSFTMNRQCFIGRENLRLRLKDMARLDASKRALFIYGSECSGKTFSYELLRVLDALNTNHVVSFIDLEKFKGEASGVQVGDIVNKIVQRITLPISRIPPKVETNARWMEIASREFEKHMKDQGKMLWLVFDHISGMASAVCDFIGELINYAALEANTIRVILLDLSPRDLLMERRVKQFITDDEARLPGREEIIEYIKCLSKEKAISREEIAECVESEFNSLVGDHYETAFGIPEYTARVGKKLGLEHFQ